MKKHSRTASIRLQRRRAARAARKPKPRTPTGRRHVLLGSAEHHDDCPVCRAMAAAGIRPDDNGIARPTPDQQAKFYAVMASLESAGPPN